MRGSNEELAAKDAKIAELNRRLLAASGAHSGSDHTEPDTTTSNRLPCHLIAPPVNHVW